MVLFYLAESMKKALSQFKNKLRIYCKINKLNIYSVNDIFFDFLNVFFGRKPQNAKRILFS
jgi:hypothetical protein